MQGLKGGSACFFFSLCQTALRSGHYRTVLMKMETKTNTPQQLSPSPGFHVFERNVLYLKCSCTVNKANKEKNNQIAPLSWFLCLHTHTLKHTDATKCVTCAVKLPLTKTPKPCLLLRSYQWG